jgi:hypothetical protein
LGWKRSENEKKMSGKGAVSRNGLCYLNRRSYFLVFRELSGNKEEDESMSMVHGDEGVEVVVCGSMVFIVGEGGRAKWSVEREKRGEQ